MHPKPWTLGDCAHSLTLIACMLLGSQVAAQPPDADDFRRKLESLPKQATADDIRTLFGKPSRVSRQLLLHRHLEQWVYERPIRVRFQFNCIPGEEATLTRFWKTP